MIEEEERIGQLQQREQSMRQLESDIVDVNTIFKVASKCSLQLTIFSYIGAQDLATMVHEQGDIVDSIESNIEATTVQVSTHSALHPALVCSGHHGDGAAEAGCRLPEQGKEKEDYPGGVGAGHFG
jgi:hypothetical protein